MVILFFLGVIKMSNKTIVEYKDEAYNKGEKIAKDLSDALNSMTFDEEVVKGFVKGITTQHRTLQQSSMRAMFAVMYQFSKMCESGHFDARNKDTVEFCKRVIDDNRDLYLPFI
jgi:phosphoenolpyruvate-protein kinase (PTS system EI component)